MRSDDKTRSEANHGRCEEKVTRYGEQVARSDEKAKKRSVTNLKKLFSFALFKSNAELADPEDIRRQSIGERGL
ncbi:hypothetical protein FLK61_37145 [Paenalkalicoccus suaedae]|uniref:Uncharacterized protein n=1 Tax=Paenalkalicoccus suaedae TaxID=2592382 RepID=A0A859FIY2_9BACI|nr:hypothetical protein FLK61_37145 [Paenalkalicoccus suaedae]